MARQLSVTIQPVDYFPTHWPVTYRVTAEIEGSPIELDDSDLQAAVEHALKRTHTVARVVPAYRPPEGKFK